MTAEWRTEEPKGIPNAACVHAVQDKAEPVYADDR